MTFGLLKEQISWLKSGTYTSQIVGWEVEIKYFSDIDDSEAFQVSVLYKSGNDGKMHLAASFIQTPEYICGKFEEVILELQRDYGVDNEHA